MLALSLLAVNLLSIVQAELWRSFQFLNLKIVGGLTIAVFKIGIDRTFIRILDENTVAILDPYTPKPIPRVGYNFPDLSQRGITIALCVSFTLERVGEEVSHPRGRLKGQTPLNIIFIHPTFDTKFQLFTK